MSLGSWSGRSVFSALALDRVVPPEPGSFYQRYGKRAFDVLVTLAVLPIVLVLIAVFAAAVWWQGGAPFYTQNRVGKDGRVFRMFKIRSMVCDADERLRAHLAADPRARQEWHVHQKLTHDPRITRLGRFIRRTSIDELPQFINVLTGEMSLIGPRPFMPDQRYRYPGTNYYAMRPGLSGLWQVTERSQSSFEQRAAYDEAYFRQLSFAIDLRILVDTLSVLVRPSGL